jgi:hypothetical protein
MITQKTIEATSDEHAKLILAAESFDSRRFSVARKLMHGSLSASNDTLKRLTEETSKAINDLRTYEQSQFPHVRPHVMPNWANFYAEGMFNEKTKVDGRRKRGNAPNKN